MIKKGGEMKTEAEFFKEHDNVSTVWENEQFIQLKYVFELMNKFAKYYHQQKLAEDSNNQRELLIAFLENRISELEKSTQEDK